MSINVQKFEDIKVGVPGDANPWVQQAANVNTLYGEYRCPVASGTPYFTTAAGSATNVCRWHMVNNLDNQATLIKVRWSVSGGATATATVTIDGTDTGTVTTTSASEVTSDITITPTTSTATRVVLLQGHISAGSGTVTIKSVHCEIVSGGLAKGLLASGFMYSDTGAYGTAPTISTERLTRVINGPCYIAKDRPRMLFCHLQSGVAGGVFAKNATAYTMVYRGMCPMPDPGKRKYIAVGYLASGSGNPSVKLVFDGETAVELAAGSSAASVSTEFEFNAGGDHHRLVPLSVYIKTTGADAYAESIQIFRRND